MTARIELRLTGALAALCIALAAGAQPPQVTSTLSVSGNVAEPVVLNVDDLKRYAAHQIDYPRRSDGAAQGQGKPARRYTGCLLRDVLTAARPTEARPRDLRKSYVVATASDGYQVVFSWAELFVTPVGASAFIVYEADGAPLGDDDGRIALVVTEDARPVRHVKWLQSLRLQAAP